MRGRNANQFHQEPVDLFLQRGPGQVGLVDAQNVLDALLAGQQEPAATQTAPAA